MLCSNVLVDIHVKAGMNADLQASLNFEDLIGIHVHVNVHVNKRE